MSGAATGSSAASEKPSSRSHGRSPWRDAFELLAARSSSPESSVTVSRNAKGAHQFEVTVRGSNAEDCYHRALHITAKLEAMFPYPVGAPVSLQERALSPEESLAEPSLAPRGERPEGTGEVQGAKGADAFAAPGPTVTAAWASECTPACWTTVPCPVCGNDLPPRGRSVPLAMNLPTCCEEHRYDGANKRHWWNEDEAVENGYTGADAPSEGMP